MITYLQTESLKNKHTAVEKLIVIMPIVFILFSLLVSGRMFGGGKSEYFMAVVYNWFPILFAPLIIAMMSSQVIERERRNHCEDYAKTLNLSFEKMWVSKIILVARNFGVIMLVNYLLTILMEVTLLHEEVSFLRMFACSVTIWLGYLALIPISMMIARYGKMFLTILLNFVLSAVGTVMAAENYWWVNPWSWSTRMTAPILGIAPNGLFIETGDKLLTMNVVPIGISISVGVFLLVSLGSMKVYKKSQEKSR